MHGFQKSTFITRECMHGFQKVQNQKPTFRRTRMRAENLQRMHRERQQDSYPFNTSPVLSAGKYKIQPEMVACC